LLKPKGVSPLQTMNPVAGVLAERPGGKSALEGAMRKPTCRPGSHRRKKKEKGQLRASTSSQKSSLTSSTRFSKERKGEERKKTPAQLHSTARREKEKEYEQIDRKHHEKMVAAPLGGATFTFYQPRQPKYFQEMHPNKGGNEEGAHFSWEPHRRKEKSG